MAMKIKYKTEILIVVFSAVLAVFVMPSKLLVLHQDVTPEWLPSWASYGLSMAAYGKGKPPVGGNFPGKVAARRTPPPKSKIRKEKGNFLDKFKKKEGSKKGFSVGGVALEGIIYDPVNPQVIINNEIKGIGDKVNGYTIKDVQRLEATLEKNGEEYALSQEGLRKKKSRKVTP